MCGIVPDGEQRLPAIERGDAVVMMVERQPGAAAHLDPGAVTERQDAPLPGGRLDAVRIGSLRHQHGGQKRGNHSRRDRSADHPAPAAGMHRIVIGGLERRGSRRHVAVDHRHRIERGGMGGVRLQPGDELQPFVGRHLRLAQMPVDRPVDDRRVRGHPPVPSSS